MLDFTPGWMERQLEHAMRTNNIMPHALQHTPSCSTETDEDRTARAQAIREFIEDGHLNPAHPTPFEIALIDAINNVEKNFNTHV